MPDPADPFQSELGYCDPRLNPGAGCFSDGARIIAAPDPFGDSRSAAQGFRGFPGVAPTMPQRQESARTEDMVREYRVIEPPTEFQRFVASSTGQLLPIFGGSLFERVPSTFGPPDRSAPPVDYRIGPGDELQTVVWGQVNFSTRLVVDQTGNVVLPGAGPVSVAGLQYKEAAGTFKAALGNIYKNFDVNVTPSSLRSIQVFVVGEARSPGSYSVSAMSSLVNAVFASGGPSSRGSMRDIQLKRGGKVVSRIDLYDLLVGGDKSKDAQLQPGDVILIPAAGPRVALAGSVSHPAIYELRSGATLGDALAVAGGLSPVAAQRQAILERIGGGGSLEAVRTPLDNTGLQTELRNGDIVQVLAVVPRFDGSVTLRGNVADPGRFPWQPGMRISDLIPDKEALLTREYWAERNKLIPDNERPLLAAAYGAGPNRPNPGSALAANGASPGDPGLDGEQFQGASQLPRSALAQSALLDRRVPYREELRNPRGDTTLAAATQQETVALRQFPPRNKIQPSAPDINWEYAVIERLNPETLTTAILPFDLGRAVLHRDPAANLALERGDVVTIFSTADFATARERQTKQVRVEGEVGMAGVYTLETGETLRRLLARAGGVTANAYLYGAQLTRESTRREQQKKLDEFVAELEKEVTASASTISGRVTGADQAALFETSLANQRQMLEGLRQTRPDGRIVLDMDPSSVGVDAIPDLPLENGDRFYVPGRPSTVNVIGTVFNQASFLYDRGVPLSGYLQKAGGPTRFGDRGHMFVIRADGSVVSRSNRAGRQTRTFASLRMFPGDTIVVPAYINKVTTLRGLIDWSQVFSNLALGAAALNVLK